VATDELGGFTDPIHQIQPVMTLGEFL